MKLATAPQKTIDCLCWTANAEIIIIIDRTCCLKVVLTYSRWCVRGTEVVPGRRQDITRFQVATRSVLDDL